MAVSGVDDQALQTAFVEAIRPFAAQGLPWRTGTRRIVFRLPRCVIKLPLCMDGVNDNARERQAYRDRLHGGTGFSMATCRISTTASGIPRLLMRLVDPVTSLDGLPDWTLFVDCGQVGLDARGRLVAYDL